MREVPKIGGLTLTEIDQQISEAALPEDTRVAVLRLLDLPVLYQQALDKIATLSKANGFLASQNPGVNEAKTEIERLQDQIDIQADHVNSVLYRSSTDADAARAAISSLKLQNERLKLQLAKILDSTSADMDTEVRVRRTERAQEYLSSLE